MGSRQHRRGAGAGAGLSRGLGRRTSSRLLPIRPEPRIGQGKPVQVDLVQPGGEALCQPAGVREHDRRMVSLDQVDDAFLDVRPDRGALLFTGCRTGQITGRLPEGGHVRDGHHDIDGDFLRRYGADEGDRPSTGEEPSDFLDRPDGGGQTDALSRSVQQSVQAIERNSQVRTTFTAGDGMHLVHDHGGDTAEHLPRTTGEQQEERLRSGDQNVGAVFREGPPITRRGVPGTDRDGDLRNLHPSSCGQRADADQWRPQVAFHVDGQCLERRKVQHAALTGSRFGRRGADESIDRREKGRQGLARAGRCDDQGVVAAADRIPGADLRGRRLRETRCEPFANQRREARRGRPPAVDRQSRARCPQLPLHSPGHCACSPRQRHRNGHHPELVDVQPARAEPHVGAATTVERYAVLERSVGARTVGPAMAASRVDSRCTPVGDGSNDWR